MNNELTWAAQAHRLANARPSRLAWMVVLALLTAILDTLGLSVFLPLLVFLQGGAVALATKLPFPFDHVYAMFAAYVAGHELAAMIGVAIVVMCLRYCASYVQQKVSIEIAAEAVSALRQKIHLAFLQSDLSFQNQRHAGARYTAIYT